PGIWGICVRPELARWVRRRAAYRKKRAAWNCSGCRLPFSSFHQFFDLTLHQVSFESADMADIELAIQMIRFMQEGAREKFFTSFLEPFAVYILGANGDFVGARDRLAKLGNAQTSFVLPVL